MWMRSYLVALALAGAAACSSEDTSKPERAPAPPPAAATIPAPPDVAAPPADAQRTPSGLAFKILQPGTGTRHPRPTSVVVAHYTGWKTNGEMVDSSVTRGEPLTYPLNKLIDGWVEGMQMMVAGEKRRFWIPEGLAYGKSADPTAPKGMLVFDIELLEVR
jgi:FKBP-type peptidyl-prolyl cis-trans isomerase